MMKRSGKQSTDSMCGLINLKDGKESKLYTSLLTVPVMNIRQRRSW